jgi:flavin-dependent dehydrogenase
MEPAMNDYYDVVVIGAGPAGSVAAYGAARLGAGVLLVDKASFPRAKVCGCCINARALAAFDRLGLGGLPQELGARPLSSMQLYAGGRRATLGLTGSVSLSRSALDTALARRAQQAGAAFLDGAAAMLIPTGSTPHRVRLRMQDGRVRHVEAGAVLAADGLAGTSLRGADGLATRVMAGSRMGVGTIVADPPGTYEDGVIYMACGSIGYVGQVMLEDGRLDVAAALDAGPVRSLGGPGAAAEWIVREAGLAPVPGLADLRWRGTPALTRKRQVIASERLFVLGDAAGYVEPFTGEGIAWAVTAAEAVVDLAVRASRRWDPALAGEWVRRHRTLVRRRQVGCRAVAWVLRRPVLVRAAVRLLGPSPRLADSLIRRVTQPQAT